MASVDTRSLRPKAALAGLALAATCALPVVEGESSVLQVILQAFDDGWIPGLVALLLLGAPFLLGLAVAASRFVRPSAGLLLVRVPVTILYAELVVVCLIVASDPQGLRAPWSLIGFGVVMTISGIARALRGRGRVGVAWLARWGATMVAAVLGWVILQNGLPWSEAPGLWATLVASAVLAGCCGQSGQHASGSGV